MSYILSEDDTMLKVQHQNMRPAYVAVLWNVVSWPEVIRRFAAARKG